MSAVVIESTVSDVPVQSMKDGDVGVITAWTYNGPVGKVVQRYGDRLIVIGEGSGRAWTSLLNSKNSHPGCRVRILGPGTIIQITA